MERNQIIGIIGLLLGIGLILRGVFLVEKPEIAHFGLPGIFVLLGVYYLFKLDCAGGSWGPGDRNQFLP